MFGAFPVFGNNRTFSPSPGKAGGSFCELPEYSKQMRKRG